MQKVTFIGSILVLGLSAFACKQRAFDSTAQNTNESSSSFVFSTALAQSDSAKFQWRCFSVSERSETSTGTNAANLLTTSLNQVGCVPGSLQTVHWDKTIPSGLFCCSVPK